MDTPEGTDVRCSTVVFRDDALLLIHRAREGTDDWTLPGGTPHAGERAWPRVRDGRPAKRPG
jgi:ADP-ribose pyrophosphatase YjhB (NUDIX family)